jgi:ArsR family transcriptional regulator
MKVLLQALKALADGNRLRILRLLLERPCCVCELQAVLEITQPSVSKHLRILEDAGLVDKQRQGQFIDYQLPGALDPGDPRASLLAWLAPRLQADPGLTALSRQAQAFKRQELCRPPGSRQAAGPRE